MKVLMRKDVCYYDREGQATPDLSLKCGKTYEIFKRIDTDIVIVRDERRQAQLVLLKQDGVLVSDKT